MDNPATYADVAARWRTLTSDEQDLATTFLGDAWRELRRLVPDLVTRLEADDADADLEPAAVAAMSYAVIRKMQNPEGLRQFSVTLDDATKSGTRDTGRSDLYFTDDELDSVRSATSTRGKAFSIMPYFDSCESSSSASS